MNLIYKFKNELKTIIICSGIYLLGFFILEKIQFDKYTYTDMWIDQYIPFIDIFVIPYILWFAYIVLGFLYFLFFDTKGFYRTCFYIFSGMYICLFIYMIFPNAQGLRVNLDLNDPLQKLLSIVYNVDTSTNVCPSIHVYNSIMMFVSLMKNKAFKSNNFAKYSVGILTLLICLSTVFTKQHALIDGFYSIPLCFLIYYLDKNIIYVKSKIISVKENIKLKLSTY